MGEHEQDHYNVLQETAGGQQGSQSTCPGRGWEQLLTLLSLDESVALAQVTQTAAAAVGGSAEPATLYHRLGWRCTGSQKLEFAGAAVYARAEAPSGAAANTEQSSATPVRIPSWQQHGEANHRYGYISPLFWPGSSLSVGSFVLYEGPLEAASSGGPAAAAAAIHQISGQAECPLTNPVAVADLSDRLAAAELICIQQQKEVVQVQQLVAAKRELQEVNRRLLDAEADYASNQLSMGSKNRQLAAQLQACKFRDEYEAFVKAGAQVFGISSDAPAENKAFADAQRLPFPLLSDPSSIMRKASARRVQQRTFGIKGDLLGLLPGRQTYVFNAAGKCVLSFNDQLNAEKHVEEALKALKA
eukprot:gene2842-3135_t